MESQRGLIGIGPCFMLGMMDGEIFGRIGSERKRQRPAALGALDEDFRKVYVL
jgi:hypothetical protein